MVRLKHFGSTVAPGLCTALVSLPARRSVSSHLLPLVISLILGGEIERYYDQSVMISNGKLGVFVQSPISVVLLCIVGAAILYLPASFLIKRARAKA